MLCSTNGCQEQAILYCICKNYYYICELHIAQHALKPSPNPHKMFPLAKTVPIKKKPEIISELRKNLTSFQEAKKNLAILHSELNNFIINSVKCISSLTKSCKIMLREALSKSSVRIPASSDQRYLKNDLDISTIKFFIKETSKNFKFFEFSNHLAEISRKFATEFSSFINHKVEKIPLFINHTQTFTEFDIAAPSHTVRWIKDIKPRGRRTCICYINPEKIFVYGGDPSSPDAYFLNPVTYEVKQLPPGIPRHSTTPIVYKDRVYVFGGWTNACLDNASYFDLAQLTWHTAAKLPSAQSDVSTVKVMGKILISGVYNFLRTYDPVKNWYKDIKSGIDPKKSNILIKNKGFVYLLAGTVYRAECSTLQFVVPNVNNKFSFEMLSCRPVVRNGYAFFVDETYKLYMFRFSDYSLKNIGNCKVNFC